jgi:hypothetical protein
MRRGQYIVDARRTDSKETHDQCDDRGCRGFEALEEDLKQSFRHELKIKCLAYDRGDQRCARLK